jgi:hypothetical protein
MKVNYVSQNQNKKMLNKKVQDRVTKNSIYEKPFPWPVAHRLKPSAPYNE